MRNHNRTIALGSWNCFENKESQYFEELTKARMSVACRKWARNHSSLSWSKRMSQDILKISSGGLGDRGRGVLCIANSPLEPPAAGCGGCPKKWHEKQRGEKPIPLPTLPLQLTCLNGIESYNITPQTKDGNSAVKFFYTCLCATAVNVSGLLLYCTYERSNVKQSRFSLHLFSLNTTNSTFLDPLLANTVFLSKKGERDSKTISPYSLHPPHDLAGYAR